jgi:lysophospholipase L1-like esterase
MGRDEDVTLVCLGDSLTYGYGIPRPRTWPSLLARATGIDVRNHGVNGDTTGGMLARFAADVVGEDPHGILVMGGFNDLALGAGLGVVKANLFALVQQCFAARIRPVLGIPIPVREPVTFRMLGSVDPARAIGPYEELIPWLRELGSDFSLPCADFRSAFLRRAGAGGDGLDALYSDGLHPSEAGHVVMAEEAVRVLRPDGP